MYPKKIHPVNFYCTKCFTCEDKSEVGHRDTPEEEDMHVVQDESKKGVDMVPERSQV